MRPPPVIRILIVDDHPLVREGLRAVLSDEPDFAIAGEADSAAAGLAEAVRLRPSVTLIDSRLPDISAREMCETLLKRIPEARILILSCLRARAASLTAVGAGARGVVLKESPTSVLREAVRVVAAGERYFDGRAGVTASELNGGDVGGPFGLTLKEMRVIEKLPRGLTNREIAQTLDVSEPTVKVHLSTARRKLQVRTRAELAAVAIREGLA